MTVSVVPLLMAVLAAMTVARAVLELERAMGVAVAAVGQWG